MKYARKKKKSYSTLIAVVVLLSLLVVGMMAWILLGKSRGAQQNDVEKMEAEQQENSGENATIPVETVLATRPVDVISLDDGKIKTPYGNLYYPDALSDHLIIVRTSEDPFTLAFYAAMDGKQEVQLFDISLGENSEGNLGVAQMGDSEVPVNVTIYSLSFTEEWQEGEISTVYAMQDVVNDIIDVLAPEQPDQEHGSQLNAQKPGKQETVNYVEIETHYCTLYYPGRWKNNLRTEYIEVKADNVYQVNFYGYFEHREVRHMFSIYFGGDEGEQLGAVMGPDGIPVPVNILMAELDVTDLTESEQETLYSMQEASNELIQMIDYID